MDAATIPNMCARCEYRARYLENHGGPYPKTTCGNTDRSVTLCDAWLPQKPQAMLKQAQSTRSAWLPAAEAVTDIEFERYFELCVSMVRGRTVICWMPRQRRLRLERLKREARLLPGKIDRRRKKYRGKSVEELVRMGVL